MSTGIQACEIVLPGYVLTERIGSGGYAEVWRAEAPGGIAKAVKIVHGYYDDEFASQELKALERIKGVRHPFLLSLERFEVLNGRLAILTELADMSLDQRLRQCRAEGLSGIPRQELLRYMADAAEALDFLSQRHSLLHLDIKPENLLILGDHIKVADFGLVKELATRTQNSLVSGMTPTYSSPEMFDDEPSAHSDQYSLAIVYQEMLVGCLPFPGRTAAQLAKQHTQSEPQLMSLPADDRGIIAKALAKKPVDRFPSCRAFVDSLLGRAETSAIATPAELPRPIPAPTTPPALDPDDTKPTSIHTTIRRTPGQTSVPNEATVTQPIQRGSRPAQTPSTPAAAAPASFVPEDIVDIAVPEANPLLRREQPTLYVAAGGVGIQVLRRLRAITAASANSDNIDRATEAIALDTDRDELREACSVGRKAPLLSDDTLHLPLRLPKSYDDSREILGWVSRRWLYNIPRSLETRGYRPLGRVALVDHGQRVRGLFDQKLQRLAAAAESPDASGEPRDKTIRVVILAGTGGGTGSGMAIDLANAARSVAATRNMQVEVHGFFVYTGLTNNNSSPLTASNTFSFLEELNHAMTVGNESAGNESTLAQLFDSTDAPFDSVYWMPIRTRTADSQSVDAFDTVVRYLALDGIPDARATLRSCRTSPSSREQSGVRSLTLKRASFASLADQNRQCAQELAADLAQAVKRHWLTKDTSADWERLVREENQAANVPKLLAATDTSPNSPPPVAPVDDTTALALRSRFKEHLCLEFASEVLRQIQRRRESRDDRGKPLMLGSDAKLIVDKASVVAASLAKCAITDTDRSCRFTESPALRSLLFAGSQRVLGHAIDTFDPRRAEQFLPTDAVDELILTECQTLLEESHARSEFTAAITSLIELDRVTESTVECATSDPLQCGGDRRTLLFVPKKKEHWAVEKLRVARPLAAVVPASVEDVLVVSEESGISPRSIALGLERQYPGIADAARRLHTRIDVDWLRLI